MQSRDEFMFEYMECFFISNRNRKVGVDDRSVWQGLYSANMLILIDLAYEKMIAHKLNKISNKVDY